MAAGTHIRLVDLSNNNGSPDFVQIRKDGYSGIIHKLTEGVGFLDPMAARNSRKARDAGLPIGFYHYARPDTGGDLRDAEREADYFLSHLHIHKGDILPALDFEETKARGMSAEKLCTWAMHWLNTVGHEIGASPMFYTYPDYLRSYLKGGKPLAVWPLWYAAYGPNDGRPHPVNVPRGFTMVLHQFTSEGTIPKVPGRYDLNRTDLKLTALTYHGKSQRHLTDAA